MPTPQEAWTDLLRELKAASEELYAAFASSSATPQGYESPPTAAPAETQRYNEALRRLDSAKAKVRAIRQYTQVRIARRLSERMMGPPGTSAATGVWRHPTLNSAVCSGDQERDRLTSSQQPPLVREQS